MCNTESMKERKNIGAREHKIPADAEVDELTSTWMKLIQAVKGKPQSSAL